MDDKESTVPPDDSNPTAPVSGSGVGVGVDVGGAGNTAPSSTTNTESLQKSDTLIGDPVNRSSVSKEDKSKKKKNATKSKKSKKKSRPVSSDSDDSSDSSSDSSSNSSGSDSDDEAVKKRNKRSKKKVTNGKKHLHKRTVKKSKTKPKPKSATRPGSKYDGNTSDSSDDSSSSTYGGPSKKKESDGSSYPERRAYNDRLVSLENTVSQMHLQISRGAMPHVQGPAAPTFNAGFPSWYYPPYPQPLAPPPPSVIPQSYAPTSAPHMDARGVPGGSKCQKKRSERPASNTDDEEQSQDDESPRTRSPKSRSRRRKSIKAEFKRVDWIWDSSLYTYKLQDTAKATPTSEYDDYAFHVRRTFDSEGKYRRTYVDIKSKLLRECLQDTIGNIQGVSLVDETPRLDPNLLFLYVEDFREHISHLKEAEPAGESRKERKKNMVRLENKRRHLKVLIRYLDIDFAKVKESLYPMLKNGLITFDLLWALWKPGTLVYTTTYGSTHLPRVFKVESADRQATMMKGEYYFVDGKYFEYDGKKFGYGMIGEEIAEFSGARKITSLDCYPLRYYKNDDQLREELIARGKKFVSLCGVHYKAYTGMAYMKRRKAIIKFNIQNSRVMVDPAIFRRTNPNYHVSLVRSRDHDDMSDYEESDNSSARCCDSSDSSDIGMKIKYVMRIVKDKDGKPHMIHVPKDQADHSDNTKELSTIPDCKDTPEGTSQGDGAYDAETALEISDDDYMMASPLVLGFAFSEKQWLEFEVANVDEIKWNEGAWESLVLPASSKDLIKALVESRKFNAANTIDDVIQGKGKGLVTVLHGPPGTGKTLTAEGISELLKCPLYMASAGELSTDSRLLESELQKMLDICHAWGAILLLDEADVFLEKRNMSDIHRNALVSIFLRQLEYFQGILFLTTNRVETFDEAFQSRIHIALRYDALDSKAKKAIFQLFIDRVKAHGKLKIEEFSNSDLNDLAKHDLNGREIKNVLGSAQDLAINKGEALSMKHIKQVLEVHAKFGRDLKGGTGFEDAMRSYT